MYCQMAINATRTSGDRCGESTTLRRTRVKKFRDQGAAVGNDPRGADQIDHVLQAQVAQDSECGSRNPNTPAWRPVGRWISAQSATFRLMVSAAFGNTGHVMGAQPRRRGSPSPGPKPVVLSAARAESVSWGQTGPGLRARSEPDSTDGGIPARRHYAGIAPPAVRAAGRPAR
jgi:hypothetical protein